MLALLKTPQLSPLEIFSTLSNIRIINDLIQTKWRKLDAVRRSDEDINSIANFIRGVSQLANLSDDVYFSCCWILQLSLLNNSLIREACSGRFAEELERRTLKHLRMIQDIGGIEEEDDPDLCFALKVLFGINDQNRNKDLIDILRVASSKLLIEVIQSSNDPYLLKTGFNILRLDLCSLIPVVPDYPSATGKNVLDSDEAIRYDEQYKIEDTFPNILDSYSMGDLINPLLTYFIRNASEEDLLRWCMERAMSHRIMSRILDDDEKSIYDSLLTASVRLKSIREILSPSHISQFELLQAFEEVFSYFTSPYEINQIVDFYIRQKDKISLSHLETLCSQRERHIQRGSWDPKMVDSLIDTIESQLP